MDLLDSLRAARERFRAIAQSGLELPAPDYTRIDVRALIDKTARR